MPNYYGPKIATDGLQLYLDAANVKSYPGSGTVWRDLSGNSNNHNLVNTPIYGTGGCGNITLDGIEEYTESTTDVTLSGNYTLEVAFRRTSARGDWVRIFGHSNDGTDRFWGIWLPAAYNYILWQSYKSGGEFSSPTYTFSLNTDYVITFSNSSTTGTMYVNGVPIGSGTTGTINYTGNTSKIRIGYAGFHTLHVGPIYYARIYNKALSANEVLENYNASKTRYGI